MSNNYLILTKYLIICLVGASSLPLLAQTTWTGTSSADWNVPGNWTAGVPSLTQDAIIPNVITNDPVIMSGTYNAKSISIQSNASLTINGLAIVNINGSVGNAITTSGALINDGTINIGSMQSIGGNGIRTQTGTLENNGIINIDNTTGAALTNIAATCTNNGELNIGSLGGIAADGIRNRSVFTNNSNIRIDGATLSGILCETAASDFSNFNQIVVVNNGKHDIWNRNGNFSNVSRIISASTSPNEYAIKNEAVLINQVCATFSTLDNFHNTGTITNEGLWRIQTTEVSMAGNFINNSVVIDIEGSFPTSSITNNQIVISQATTTSVNTVVNAFELGSMFNHTILGIYTDFSLNTPAGTYDQSTNIFTPSPNLTPGINSLVVNIKDPNCFFTYRIEWQINALICPAVCSSGADKCWSGFGGDQLWSNPANWCPFGVPATDDWVDLGNNHTVDYDVTGPVINRLDLASGTTFTILNGTTLEIDNSIGNSHTYLFFNRGTVINEGNLIITNAQGLGLFTLGAVFDNYGIVKVSNTGLTNPGYAIEINGMNSTWTNYPNSRIEVQDALQGGLVIFQNAQLLNQADALIEISKAGDRGLLLSANAHVSNLQSGTIRVSDMNSGAIPLEVFQGSTLNWEFGIDISN